MSAVVVSGISFGFPELSPCEGQIAHVLLTRSPLVYPRRGLTARLACVKHAASVRPEPGSNSPLKSLIHTDARSALIDSRSIPARVIATPEGHRDRFLPKEPSCRNRDQISHPADGALINSFVDFWHTVEFSRIVR